MRRQPKPALPSFEHVPGSPLAKLLPELSVIALALWALTAGWHGKPVDINGLQFVVIADGATLMASGTLIDIASRIKRAPPWWVLPIALIGLLLVYPEVWQLAQAAWQLGFWLFLPFAWSIFERVREIWTLPSAPLLEKVRRRALTFDRLYTGLMIGSGFLIIWLALLAADIVEFGSFSEPDGLLWPILAFYSINAGNVIRVHRPRFAKQPRSLWPWFDAGDAASLDELRL